MADPKTPDVDEENLADNSEDLTDEEEFLGEIGLDSSGDWNGVPE